jgi:predicted restriction endonuclease
MNFIEELAEEAKGIVAALQNDRFKGIKKILTDIYHDDAHFIYELLQNAEDAQATKINFILDANGLKISHDGNRQFTKQDIVSINSIANNKKKGDFNTIGEFGVGFKSVFSYTNTPRVFSGDWAFEIHDLICPKVIPQVPEILNDKSKSTFFEIPFNHAEKPKDRAFQEVKQTLISLTDNTILFLQNIKEISWEIKSGKSQYGHIKLLALEKENHFEVERKSEKPEKTYWVKFTAAVPGKGKLLIGIAFRLEKIKGTNNFKIDSSVNKADVSIFFPAEKEISNLRFYLNAPFAATVARDSIQNKSENEKLRDLLIDLFVKSLPQIRQYGLLDRNFLEILPNHKDNLSAFYEPFRAKIIEIFREKNFTPTWDNNHSPANKLIQTNNEIKKIVNNKTILNFLVDDDIDWVINAKRDSRAFDFLEGLEIEEWDWRDLIGKVHQAFTDKDRASEALTTMSDEWMQGFYLLLEKAFSRSRDSIFYIYDLYGAFIVRLSNGDHVCGYQAYFPIGELKDLEGISVVKSELYSSHKDGNQNKRIEEFLKHLRVKEFGEEDEIKLILERYYEEESEFNLTQEEHLKHLRKFIKFWKSQTGDTSIFADYYILRGEDKADNAGFYCKPSSTFLDTPYEQTKLSVIESYLNDGDTWKIWSGYQTKIKNQKDFISFIKDIGVEHELKIERISIYNNPSLDVLLQDKHTHRVRESYATCINEDYEIDNLAKLLKTNDREVSLLIWETLSRADKKVFQARYSPNSNYQPRTAPSQLACLLMKHAWILGKDGKFYTPQKITTEMLPKNFSVSNSNRWFDAIDFGAKVKKTGLDKQERNRIAKLLNLKVTDLERASEFAKLSDEEKDAFEQFKKQIAERKSKLLKESNTRSDHNKSKRKNAVKDDLSVREIENKKAEDKVEKKILQRSISEYSKTQLVESRIGQGVFRSNLECVEDKCRLTGVTDKRFLIASHIKPWKESDDAEKLDGNNGLFLSPHADKLFDKGWISFTDDGFILCDNAEIKDLMKTWGLDSNKLVGSFNERQKKYLAYHRENIFKAESGN